jgi:predicted amidohydrolase
MFPQFKLGMAQMYVEGGEIDRNLERAKEMIKEASEKECKIVVLPECLDVGWTHPSAKRLAKEIPGETSNKLCKCAQDNRIMVIAGLTERKNNRFYNSAILIDEEGCILVIHRKINVLKIAQDLYDVGTILSITDTAYGMMGINICADNFPSSLAIGHVLARMGAHFIFSPSAWAVKPDHDNAEEPYGRVWRESYFQLCKLYGITIAGVSNVGWITGGPWEGRKIIGCSLCVGPDGRIIAEGSYGANAEALITVDIQAKTRDIKGTEYADYLKMKGYKGP